MKSPMMLAVVLAVSALLAAPVEKIDPVAPGFPVWTGVTAKNHISGRELSPSDLRHKVTIVLDVDVTDKLQEQLMLAGSLMERSSVRIPESGVSEDWTMPRTYATVVSCRGPAKKEAVEAAMAPKKGDKEASQALRAFGPTGSCSVYFDVAYAGMENTEGKRPYIFVFGPTGATPLFHGTLTADSRKEALAAADKAAKELRSAEPPWKPFFGNIPEPKYNTTLKKTLEKGKTAKKAPLDPIAKALLTDVKSKDEEKAKEAQVLFDAINQTRSDLIYLINLEAHGSPHRAYNDVQTLLKYWPMEMKRLDPVAAKALANPEFVMLGKTYMKLKEWSDPAYTIKNASEAKKIIAELNKMKKALSGPKESKSITVQNCALLIDMKVDELIPIMQSRAEAK